MFETDLKVIGNRLYEALRRRGMIQAQVVEAAAYRNKREGRILPVCYYLWYLFPARIEYAR